jgi:EAL domain-containing protein (putative c-di-GMP-specific phosphodiesterase class I)
VDWLRDRGCPFAQGYLLSPPLEAEMVEGFLQGSDGQLATVRG